MTQVRLRNLTPHAVDLYLPDGHRVTLPAEPPAPRLEVNRGSAFLLHTQIGDVPVSATGPVGPVHGLPDRLPDTWLIVARAIAQALPSRHDLLFPDDLVRDATTGQVVGCRALARMMSRTVP
jgi:hypothetical protein